MRPSSPAIERRPAAPTVSRDSVMNLFFQDRALSLDGRKSHQPVAKQLHAVSWAAGTERFQQTKLGVCLQHQIVWSNQRARAQRLVDQIVPGQSHTLPAD